MKLLFVILALLGIGMQGCCIKENRVEPSYPSNLSGWEGRKKPDGSVIRDFVLRKGQAIDNGEVQVKVVDIIPGDPCAEGGSFLRVARARIQFVRLADLKFLCEETFAERSASIFSPDGCGSSQSDVSALKGLGIFNIHVTAINLKEEWVSFGLLGYYR